MLGISSRVEEDVLDIHRTIIGSLLKWWERKKLLMFSTSKKIHKMPHTP